MQPQFTIRTSDVRRRFDRAAGCFDDADFVHSVTREGLFARLEPVVIDAKTVVDLGCATGATLRLLQKRFRGSMIVGVDLSRHMLERSRARRGWLSRAGHVQADARALPFADASVDVVFSNLMLPWVDDIAPVAEEVSRVLVRDGLFVFSTLGPDSLGELRSAWAAIDAGAHVRPFADMHDVGDTLVRARLRDPVLDVDRLTVTYTDTTALFRDLTATGARNSLEERRRSLTGPARLKALAGELESAGAHSPMRFDLEIVYGHAWGSGRGAAGGEVRIDPGAIPRRRR